MFRTWRMFARLFCLALIVLCATGDAFGQAKKPTLKGLGGGLGSDIGFGGDDATGDQVTASGYFTQPDANGRATLFITAEIAPGWHIYSITQKPGGPNKTKLIVNEAKGVHLLDNGTFSPNPLPQVHRDERAFPGVDLEEHSGSVTWQAPIHFDPGVDPSKIEIKGAVHAQACKETCLFPKDYSFAAKVRDESRSVPNPVQSPVAPSAGVGSTEFTPAGSHATLSGTLAADVVAPGGTIKLTMSLAPLAGWHTYEYAERERPGYKPTLITLAEPADWHISAVKADRAPVQKKSPAEPGVILPIYEQPVSWTVEIPVPVQARDGQTKLVGFVGVQTCSDANCDLPKAARYEVELTVGKAAGGMAAPLRFQEAKYHDVAQKAAQQSPIKVQTEAAAETMTAKTFGVLLALAFVAGLILNLMPCVLPVIGLKVLSFVQQAGQDRRQVFMLNVWYGVGIISVFMVLATLAVVAHLGWGAQFSNPSTTIVLACVVFVFALSFLGVWEIPIPGFVGSSAAHDLTEREGPMGAVLKGVLTTVLATPCVGPFLGPTIAEAIKHPWYITYPVFAFVGLGMSSPYLIVGANPSLLRFVPKPGQWMETFKQLMGFILLGTVVWLMTTIEWPRMVPTFAMMISLWAACWWIGRTPLTETLDKRLGAWVGAAVFAAAMAYFSFHYLEGYMRKNYLLALDSEFLKREERLASEGGTSGTAGERLWQLFEAERSDKLRHIKDTGSSELPWQAFTRTRLKMLQARGFTVFVDFSAPWCATCKVNEGQVLNTAGTQKVVDELNIVTLAANVDDEDAAAVLHELAGQTQGVPYYVVYPAGKPEAPIRFGVNVLITQDEVAKSLREAGPSKGNANANTAALRATGKSME